MRKGTSVGRSQRAPRCLFAALAPLGGGNVASVLAGALASRLQPDFGPDLFQWPDARGELDRARAGSGVADSSPTGGTVRFRWQNDSFLTLTNETSTMAWRLI
jgi:hypothetical protein